MHIQEIQMFICAKLYNAQILFYFIFLTIHLIIQLFMSCFNFVKLVSVQDFCITNNNRLVCSVFWFIEVQLCCSMAPSSGE